MAASAGEHDDSGDEGRLGADGGGGALDGSDDGGDDDDDDDVEPLLKFKRIEGNVPEILAGDMATALAVHQRYLVGA